MRRIRVLVIALMLILGGALFGHVKAVDTTITLGVQPQRPYSDDNGDNKKGNDIYRFLKGSYNLNKGYTIFKLYEQGDKDSYNKIFYCLRGRVGFGADGNQDVSEETQTYTKLGEMHTNADTIIEKYKELYKTQNSSGNGVDLNRTVTINDQSVNIYNAILWVLDNSYLPKDNTESGYKASEYKDELLDKAGIAKSKEVREKITDDDIEVIQQLALWFFANYDDTETISLSRKTNGNPDLNIANYLSVAKDANSDDSNNNVFFQNDDGTTNTRLDSLNAIYTYLINGAIDANGSYSNSSNRTITQEPATFDHSKELKIKSVNNTGFEDQHIPDSYVFKYYYKIGPFSIENNDARNKIIATDIMLIDKDGNPISKYYTNKDNKTNKVYEIIDGSEKTVTELTRGQEYYIKLYKAYTKGFAHAGNIVSSIPENYKYNLEGITLKISTTYSLSKATFYYKDSASQPVVEIEKGKKTDGDTITSVPEKEFDLSLRKFITKIMRNGEKITVTDRTPQINTETLIEGIKNRQGETEYTATYTHPKNALAVKTGDKVTYTIRVYNEGEIDGKATEITDYLPDGLKLVDKNDSKTNEKYGWKTTAGNDRIITSNYLNDTVIKAFNSNKSSKESGELWQKATTGAGGLYYADVEVECEVTAKANGQNQTLRNIAAITEDKDDKGQDVTDRDSEPDNPGINDYTPPADDNSTYKEDDDDYEPLVLEAVTKVTVKKEWNDANDQDGKRTPNVEIQLYKTISGNKTSMGDEYKVTLSSSNTWTHTFDNLPKYSDGSTIKYTVEEVSVPTGYTVSITEDTSSGNFIFTITNTHTPETTEVSVKKVWNDTDDQDGIRPNSVDVQLYKTILGKKTPVGDKLTLNDFNSWSHTFRNLPKYSNKVKIEYTVEEATNVPNYKPNITSDGENKFSFTITNTYTPNKINIPVTKIWEDGDNVDKLRPDSITVTLYADGEKTNKTLILNESNAWSGRFTDLDEKKDGVNINYTIEEETNLPKYTTTIDGDQVTGFTITNKHTPLIFDLALRKSIVAVNEITLNEEKSRVPNVNTNPLKGDETTADYNHRKDPVEVKIGDIITYRFSLYNEGEVDGYVYSIVDYLPAGLTFDANSNNNFIEYKENYSDDELSGKDYIYKIEGNKVTITKANGRYLFELSAFNGSDLDSKSIDVKFKVTAQKSMEDQILTNVATMTYGPKDLIKDDRDSKADEFNVPSADELLQSLPGYKGKGSNKNELGDSTYHYEGQQDDDDFEKIFIKGVTSVSGTKTWVDYNNADNTRPNSITIKLLRNGTEIDSKNVTYAEDWSYSFDDLERFDPEGNEYTYTIQEDPVPNYTTDINGYNVTNTYTTSTSISGTKTWVDHDNIDNLRPTSITINLFRNGEKITSKEVTIADNWSYTFDNLEKYDSNGNTYVYTIEEEPVQGYTTEINGYDIVNTHKIFDLSLRKFITEIKRNGKEVEIADRVPKINTETLINGTYDRDGKLEYTATYTHPKDAITVKHGDIITYTLRIYNEGERDGYATEVTDYIPEGLALILNHKTNFNNGWKLPEDLDNSKVIDLVGENGLYASEEDIKGLSLEDFENTESLSEVELVTGKVAITTNTLDDELIKAFDQEKTDEEEGWQKADEGKGGLYYKDIQVTCMVIAENTYKETITNVAEISEDKDKDGKDVTDRDSTPDNKKDPYDKWQEDDDDYEPVELKYFDLALRKFITGVETNGKKEEVTTRVPNPSIGEDGKIKYEHDKDPVYVANNDIVTYTIRVYNEGTIAGYAEKITDDIPEGLEYLPENETNKKYVWVMIDENGEETEEVEKAEKIVTDYLSEAKGEESGRNNLINGFDISKGISTEEPLNPDYRDVEVAFRVIEPSTSDRIITNHAQISEDSDDDEDSVPDEWNEGEDDQDEEKVYVKYFDLSLLKWVTQTIVTVDGKTTTRETGFKPNTGKTETDGIRDNNDPEPVAKVEIDRKKLNKTTVKFVYKIRVTNEGEIAGYATEVTDFIPEGLEFVESDNTKYGWKKDGDGKVATRALETVLLEPGEYAEVEIVFRWKNGTNNLGLKTNVAEITEDYNENNSKDIDSVPDNKKDPYEKEQEDDDDFAEVILSIKTGVGPSYVLLITTIVGTLGIGIYLIKRYVLTY